jgi:hypothetical protein
MVQGQEPGYRPRNRDTLSTRFLRCRTGRGNKDELEQTAADVNAAGAESLVCPQDLREPKSAEILVKSALDRLQGRHIARGVLLPHQLFRKEGYSCRK